MESRTAGQIWEAALGALQIQVNKPNYRTWLEKTEGLGQSEGQFTVGVPNTFVAEYLDRNQRSLIEKVLTGLLDRDIRVQFQVSTGPSNLLPAGKPDKAIAPQQASLPLFNPRYTFESFIVGQSNQFAYAAAQTAAQNPGQNYNPLYIHAAAGLGKTHLLHAIGHAAAANNLKALYVSAEQYTNELLTAIREKKTEDFRGKYRSADMLLVDDIQFFAGKERTGESFFHTFNELQNTNRQIAVTCDRPPQAMPQLPDALRSRLEGGLVTDIQPPDFGTRLAILQAKTRRDGEEIAPDVLEYIALQIQQNIRALEGSLNRVIAYAQILKKALTPELAASALRADTALEPAIAAPTPDLIIEAVVNSFQLTPSDLISRKRDAATALARQVALYLIRQETNCSLAQAGKALGGRSPATVTYAYQKIAADINNSPSLRHKIYEIQQKISGQARLVD